MSTTKTTRLLYEEFSKIASNWPKDALRPEISFGQEIIRSSERALLLNPPKKDPPPQTSNSQGITSRLNTKTLEFKELNNEQKNLIENSIKSLKNIQNSKLSKDFPIPLTILRPQSNFDYYSKLADMLDKATRGERVEFSLLQRIRLFFGFSI